MSLLAPFSTAVFSRLTASVGIFVLSPFRFLFLGAVFIGTNSRVLG